MPFSTTVLWITNLFWTFETGSFMYHRTWVIILKHPWDSSGFIDWINHNIYALVIFWKVTSFHQTIIDYHLSYTSSRWINCFPINTWLCAEHTDIFFLATWIMQGLSWYLLWQRVRKILTSHWIGAGTFALLCSGSELR